MKALIDQIHAEGLAFSCGSSPHESGKPVHTVYAAVAASYDKLHRGTANEVGRGYDCPGCIEEALRKAYDDFRSRNPA